MTLLPYQARKFGLSWSLVAESSYTRFPRLGFRHRRWRWNLSSDAYSDCWIRYQIFRRLLQIFCSLSLVQSEFIASNKRFGCSIPAHAPPWNHGWSVSQCHLPLLAHHHSHHNSLLK